MTAPLIARARAKINLTLHVLGRREDGYHELESLVAFAGAGDRLTFIPGESLSLAVEGPTAALAGPETDNLVLKAVRELSARRAGLRLGAFSLVKRLPVAAGIGGGSSDAAAALRLLARANAVPLSDPAIVAAAQATGADVPVCLEARARMMRGIGTELGAALRLAPLFAVLVNPGVPVPTSAVFRALALASGIRRPGSPHPVIPAPSDRQALLAVLAAGRNDLEAGARAVAPAVDEVLALLASLDGARLARMSGSGGTCFALFDDRRAAASAAKAVRCARPGWWAKATVLR